VTGFKKLLWMPFLCVVLAGCATARRDSHVFCASVLGFVGDYPGASRQFQTVVKIDMEHRPSQLMPDTDMLVWYDSCLGRDQAVMDH
jgi:hypothetical protein